MTLTVDLETQGHTHSLYDIKGVVVFQVGWGMLRISAAKGVWMVTLLR